MKQKTKHVNFIFIGIAVLLLLLWNGLSFISTVFIGPWWDIAYIVTLIVFFPILIVLENLLFALKYWIFSPRSKIKTIFKIVEIVLSGCTLIWHMLFWFFAFHSYEPYYETYNEIFSVGWTVYLAFLIIVVWIAEIVFQIVFMLKNRRKHNF